MTAIAMAMGQKRGPGHQRVIMGMLGHPHRRGHINAKRGKARVRGVTRRRLLSMCSLGLYRLRERGSRARLVQLRKLMKIMRMRMLRIMVGL